MDYEKAYKDALERAKKIHDSPNASSGRKEWLESIFPELAESEDERIRKEIVNFIRWAIDRGSITKEQRERSDTWITYLEKQKEQKPNIEHIQRSWYMEGYHDAEFKHEPKWIIKTGKGGPRHELNPRYGEPLAEQNPGDKDRYMEGYMNGMNDALKEQEQIEVDLEKEIDEKYRNDNDTLKNREQYARLARHFYELGRNARKED